MFKKNSYTISNQAGVLATIEQDGIWTRSDNKTQKHFFQQNIESSWFDNPNAKLSISGNFLYMIVDGDLLLVTLTADKDNELYIDVLGEGTQFCDANFSYEETILYGLTNLSNTIIIFSLLPPRKIQEFIFDWDFYGTSFQIILLPPSQSLTSTNAFLIESRDKSDVEIKYFYIPTDYTNLNPDKKLILQPINEDKTSLFKNIYFDQNQKQAEPLEIDDDENDDNEIPETKEQAANALFNKGKQLKQYEEELENRAQKVKDRLIRINAKYESIKSGFQQSRDRFENLSHRIQKLIERADNGFYLVKKADSQKKQENLLKSLDKNIPYLELDDDIIFEFRTLQGMINMLQYRINNLE